jgi:hypothetical protein
MLSTINRGESLQPSVQLPAGGERKAGFIGLFERKARIVASVAVQKFAPFLPRVRDADF